MAFKYKKQNIINHLYRTFHKKRLEDFFFLLFNCTQQQDIQPSRSCFSRYQSKKTMQNRGFSIFIRQLFVVKKSGATILIGSFVLKSFLLGLAEFSGSYLSARRMRDCIYSAFLNLWDRSTFFSERSICFTRKLRLQWDNLGWIFSMITHMNFQFNFKFKKGMRLI